MPRDPAYKAMLAENFANWRLRIDGLVDRPAAYSIGQLRVMPARSQITRHDCVEGWSAIGKWTGVPLAALPFMLSLFGGRQSARTLHFVCANLIVLFVIVHVVEVFLAGVWNEMRSMITGWYVVKPEASDGSH